MSFYQLLGTLAIGGISSYLAHQKGKNPFLWFFLGMFFGIFGILYLYFSKGDQKEEVSQTEELDPHTIDITPTFDPILKEKFWYYLDQEKERKGPMSFDALKRDFIEGKVSKKTFVWNETLEKWTPFGEFIRFPS